MPLISLVVWLIVIGVVLYLVNMIPMDATIKKIIQIVVIVIVLLWWVSVFLPSGGPVLHWPR